MCDFGFGIGQGDRMRICGGFGSSTEGMWSGEAAVCQRKSPLNLEPRTQAIRNIIFNSEFILLSY